MKYILKYDVDKKNVIKDLLLKKGISDPEEYIYITKKYENDPALLDNIERACHTVIDHLNAGHKVYLQPDSDLDGYMSSSIFYGYIKRIWPDAEIIWQVHEGKQHGVNMSHIPDDVKLAVFPDAASNNFKEHAQLKAMGIDVVVLDHHHAEKVSEDAIVVNNQLCDYPNKYLSGGGITYKFIQMMDRVLGKDISHDFIDLCAISLVGDMMDLRDYENRWIVKDGLSNIKNSGLKSLMSTQSYSIWGSTKEISEIEKLEITPTAIAFYIVPLVNAIVRVGTESEKELLFESFIDGLRIIPSTKRGDKGNFETVAQQAARNCTNARSRQNRLKEKAIDELTAKIEKNELHRNQVIFVNVEDDETFDSTLTGLIAMNFLSKYKKPTIVARLSSDGFWRGSARGSNSTDLKDLKGFFKESNLFEFVEGHANAFGCSIHTDNVEKLIDYSNKELREVQFNENSYEVDLIYSSKEDVGSAIEQIAELKNIWGQGVDEPIIVVEDIKLYPEDVSFIGAGKDTIKFSYNGVSFLKFKDQKFVDEIKQMKNGFSITLIGKASVNEWNGTTTPQIFIDDYAMRDTTYDF